MSLFDEGFAVNIAGHDLEFYDKEHIYLVDGIEVPSITRIVRSRFQNKYDGIDRKTLQMAVEKGTELHEAIERLCRYGEPSDLKEVRNFLFLQKQYGFEVVANEVPVILFKGEKAVAAGRLDLVLRMGGKIGGADIKRTSGLDKNYLAYQLNLYRIAYRQSWGTEWEFLRGLHLREDVRKFVQIPIDEQGAWELVNEFLGVKK